MYCRYPTRSQCGGPTRPFRDSKEASVAAVMDNVGFFRLSGDYQRVDASQLPDPRRVKVFRSSLHRPVIRVEDGGCQLFGRIFFRAIELYKEAGKKEKGKYKDNLQGCPSLKNLFNLVHTWKDVRPMLEMKFEM